MAKHLKTDLVVDAVNMAIYDLRTAISEYVEGFYNTRRRHFALGHLSPSNYEEAIMEEALWPKGS